MSRAVAFIPARGGSRRVPHKALRTLNGKPLIWWTIEAAYRAGLRSIVATDDGEIARVALGLSRDPDLGVFYREPSPDDEPDIVWVRKALDAYPDADPFLILRPTSPFRDEAIIHWALAMWRTYGEEVDSARTVTPSPCHPGKMWKMANTENDLRIVPFLANTRPDGVPWHSSPTQSLPVAYVQTAGMEIAHRKTVTEQNSISGMSVLPLVINGRAALDINTEDDLREAEACLLNDYMESGREPIRSSPN